MTAAAAPDRRFTIRAACAEHLDVNFDPDEGKPKLVAACLKVCSACPVRDECLAAAIAEERDGPANFIFGIRGGLTAAQRRRVHGGLPAGPAESAQVRRGQAALTRIVAVLADADEPLTAREVHERVNADEPRLTHDVVNRGLAQKLAGVVERERATARTDRMRGIEYLYRLPANRATNSEPATAYAEPSDPVTATPRKSRDRNVDQRVLAVLEAAGKRLTGVEIHHRLNKSRQEGEPELKLSTVLNTLSNGKRLGITLIPRWREGPSELKRTSRGTEHLYGLGTPTGRSVHERVAEVLATLSVPSDRREIHRRVNDESRQHEPPVPLKVIQYALNRAYASGRVTREGIGVAGQDEFHYQVLGAALRPYSGLVQLTAVGPPSQQVASETPLLI